MPEHFTKTTLVAKFWCKKCFKPTMHDVHDGRRGACHECLAKLEAEKAAQAAVPPPEQQESLF